MKVLVNKDKGKSPPRKIIKQCYGCSSYLEIQDDDCYAAKNGFNESVWAARCPVCGAGVVVCEQ